MRQLKTILAVCVILCAALLCGACGESGFGKIATFIAANGTVSEDGSYAAVTGKSADSYFSAMYYADDAELAIGLRRNTEDGADALILIISEDNDYCDLLFTCQKTGQQDPVYAARCKLLPADPVCRRLSAADGASGDDDYGNAATLALVNGYLSELLIGADAYIFDGSGLSMTDLGFKY